MDWDSLQLGLIQARTSTAILRQEQECFAERLNISLDQIQAYNVIEAIPGAQDLDAFDVLMIGGSGEFSAVNHYEWMPQLLELVTVCCQRAFPLFGSCWGHQIIARALGGTVIHDQERAELGCGRIFLTEAGRLDPIMMQFPNEFDANMGHHDRVATLPDNGIELARSESQGNQMFRIQNLPVYGTQFHSELDKQREAERLHEYREQYANSYSSEAEFQQVVDSLHETTEVDGLMRAFVDCYVLPSR